MYPAWSKAVRFNIILWREEFWRAWESLPLDRKLIWLFFIGQTIAIITLIEFFLLK